MREAREWDYRQTLGFNPLPDETDPEFQGEVPTDAKGYAAYRRKAEQNIEQHLGMSTVMRVSYNCESRAPNGQPIRCSGQSKEHTGCEPVFACNHVIHNDEENPHDIHFVPLNRDTTLGYYLCSYCYKSMLNYRLNIGRDVCGKCSKCVLEALMKQEAKKPGRIINHLAN